MSEQESQIRAEYEDAKREYEVALKQVYDVGTGLRMPAPEDIATQSQRNAFQNQLNQTSRELSAATRREKDAEKRWKAAERALRAWERKDT